MRLVAIFAAGTALAGCGQVNHGAAQVVDADGQPVPSALVQFWCGDAANPRKSGFTGQDGRYDFGFEADFNSTQSGTLVASKPGYDQTSVRYVATRAGNEITIVLPQRSAR